MRLRSAVPAVLTTAALLLLPACGGGEPAEPDASSASSPRSTSAPAAPSSDAPAGGDADAFCTDAPVAVEGTSDALDAATGDYSALPAVLADAAADLGALEPPAEIADTWQRIVVAVEQVSAAAGGADLTLPEGRQQFEEQASAAFSGVGPDLDAVDAWIAQNCQAATPG